MKWKRHNANLIVVALLSLAYTIVTLMMIIAPLHMNSLGDMNQVSGYSLYAIAYWAFALAISWYVYIVLQHKPSLQFFTLMILGIVIIIVEIFLWS